MNITVTDPAVFNNQHQLGYYVQITPEFKMKPGTPSSTGNEKVNNQSNITDFIYSSFMCCIAQREKNGAYHSTL